MSKIKHLSVIVVSAYLALFTSMVSAACTRADFTGTWKIYDGEKPPLRCKIIIPSTGTSFAAKSSCRSFGLVIIRTPITGTNLIFGSDCHITGDIKIGEAQSQKLDAWISKGKDSIAGVIWNPNDDTDPGNVSFSGVK